MKIKDKPNQILFFCRGVFVDLSKGIIFLHPLMMEQDCIRLKPIMNKYGIKEKDIVQAIDYALVNRCDIKDVPPLVGPKLCSSSSNLNTWKNFYNEVNKKCDEVFERDGNLFNEISLDTRTLLALLQTDKIDMLHLNESLKESLIKQVSGGKNIDINKIVVMNVLCTMVSEILKE